MSKLRFDSQAAIVTGAGRGIGSAHAIELAERGARVVVNDLDADAADEVVAEISTRGGTAITCAESVATEEGGRALVQACLDNFGRVDIVINNAGLRRNGYFHQLSIEDVRTVLDSHLWAAFFVTKPAWDYMRDAGYGRIIMTSSSSGMFSNQGLSSYAAAKAGIYGLTKALAYEGMAHDIKVNAILPFAATKVPGEPDRVPDMATERVKYVPAELTAKVPRERSDPVLVAKLACYLVHASCPVSGEAYSVCYGRYARVFVGVADGWITPDPTTCTVEDIAEHLTEIRDLTHTTTPMWIFDEVADVVRRVVS